MRQEDREGVGIGLDDLRHIRVLLFIGACVMRIGMNKTVTMVSPLLRSRWGLVAVDDVLTGSSDLLAADCAFTCPSGDHRVQNVHALRIPTFSLHTELQ